MNLRRGFEFAFGVAVFSLGGGFLVLALGHLSAPISNERIAVAAAPARSVVTGLPVSRSPRRPQVAVAVPGHPIATRPHATATLRVVARPTRPTPMARTTRTPALANANATATAASVFAKPHVAELPVATMPRKVAHAIARHVAIVRRAGRAPTSDATPEPPIGYDDRPTLLHANGLDDSSPAPVASSGP